RGRRSYVSIRRARPASVHQAQLFEGAQRAELEAIVEWLRTTRDGSLQDLPFEPSAEVWDEVASESDVCLRARCPHFEECFYQRSRRDAAGADVLVVNHHLLFSDLAVRRAQGNYTAPAVLPPYRRVILDEAHNLEDAATSHLGAAVSRRGLFRLLARLDRRGRGVLAAVEERLRAGRDDLLQQDALRRIGAELRPQVERLREHAAELFIRLETAAGRMEDGMLRLDVRADAVPGLDEPLEGVLVGIAELARGLDRLRESLQVDTRWQEALAEEVVESAGCEGGGVARAGGAVGGRGRRDRGAGSRARPVAGEPAGGHPVAGSARGAAAGAGCGGGTVEGRGRGAANGAGAGTGHASDGALGGAAGWGRGEGAERGGERGAGGSLGHAEGGAVRAGGHGGADLRHAGHPGRLRVPAGTDRAERRGDASRRGGLPIAVRFRESDA